MLVTPEIVMCLSTSPASAPRVPCQRCGQIVAVEMILRPEQRVVCIACVSDELEAAIRAGERLPVVAARPAAIEAWKLYLAPVEGQPS